MSRTSKIRWRKTDEEELSRIIRNYNSKISRIIKKEPFMETYLPQKLTKKEIKDKIYSRKDFNKEIAKIKRFSKRGSEKVVPNMEVTQYELNEFKIVFRNNEIRKKKELEKLMSENVMKGHEKTLMNRHEMGNIKRFRLKPKKIESTLASIKSKTDFSEFMESLEHELSDFYKEKRKDSFKNNYLKSVREVYGANNELYELIDKMNLDTFVNIAGTDDLYLRIDFIYDPLAKQDKMNTILNTWNKYLSET